jgi:1-aminocyclopropane-1-carboxylate deaminase
MILKMKFELKLDLLKQDFFSKKEVSVSVLRLDMIHPHISGNKWFKLKYNLEAFKEQKKKYLVTFGGAFSNHIVATAAAGKENEIETIGIIRGEELNENSNHVLKFASSCGMKLFFVTRDDYRMIRETASLPERIYAHPDIYRDSTLNSELYFLPEGGSNTLAVKGCEEIVKNIHEEFDYIICAVGTGSTLAGISKSLKEGQTAIGIPVLEGKSFLEKDILNLNGGRKNFQLVHDYSFGGYAKSTGELELFCQKFSNQHGIKIEPVYTGKMFYALYDLIEKNYFNEGSKIVAIHSGGIQFEVL